jgi:hypothetical protein
VTGPAGPGPGRAHRRGLSATAWLAAFGGLVVLATVATIPLSILATTPAADTARRLPRGRLAGPVGRDVEPVSAGTAVAVAP